MSHGFYLHVFVDTAKRAVETAPVVFFFFPLTLIMNQKQRREIPDHELAFKGGPNGETLGPVLQARLNYDASRFRAALRAMFKQTDAQVLKWQHSMMQKETVCMIR